ncbi:dissimilatory-type sulfite reductase subunit alpha [Carboxydothermus hydrogenoformans]|uniref:Dissimilatory sulfite reductase alpha subunit n=1 Tax=Carboxydothermus hydrogenoformans (strain ATCC BAA-161 / DSM 6008 / Z-2901) TaxID=246194 RepID=Q3A9H7_CARHZ|nr:dissimilatory-type sulfite reductase subunit alpha [Carboxydothermus hydrogenoformans]ABB13832.1 dissimilatory sulfite reductase alpha subunit [Carboxydothermus hydrogenoformans Z-2901]
MANEEKKTPLLDQLEEGRWPSFVKEIKKAAAKNKKAEALLGQLELSYREKKVHWKHGGIVGVKGYGGGVIGRYSDVPEQFPDAAEFHTIRVNQPAGWFYTTEALRKLCDIWEKYGSGLTNFHGSTGDAILLGTDTDKLQACFDELAEAGFDLGGSGSDLRTPSCCVGPARCEFACFDTLDVCHEITMEFQNELHRPMWPYKFKIKIAGCPNDCVASIARADLSVIGTWRDEIRVNQEEVKAYAEAGFDIQGMVVDKCPKKAVKYNAETREIVIDNESCTRCMHCINEMPRALRVGKEGGATLLIGAKAPIVKSAFMSWVIIPFMEMKPPYTELKDFIRTITDWWDENGKTRERIGETIYRLGMPKFLRDTGIKPVPQMVTAPRANPYYFWYPEEVK